MIDPDQPEPSQSPAQPDPPPLTESELARQMALRVVARELADIEASEAAVRAGLSARARRRESSIVYSIRLDPEEVRALEIRAAARGVKPTRLARNLIRSGLARDVNLRLAEALDSFEAALAELRDAADAAREWPWPGH